jgi:hypothetical protein
MRPCSLVGGYQHFQVTCHFHPSHPNVERVYASETLIITSQVTQCHNVEGRRWTLHYRYNFKSHKQEETERMQITYIRFKTEKILRCGFRLLSPALVKLYIEFVLENCIDQILCTLRVLRWSFHRASWFAGSLNIIDRWDQYNALLSHPFSTLQRHSVNHVSLASKQAVAFEVFLFPYYVASFVL